MVVVVFEEVDYSLVWSNVLRTNYIFLGNESPYDRYFKPLNFYIVNVTVVFYYMDPDLDYFVHVLNILFLNF